MVTPKRMHPDPAQLPLYGDRRRVAFVTGASGGLGKAIALRLARDGLDVAVNDIESENLEKVQKEIEQLGVRSIAVVGDVSDELRVEQMVNETTKELGYLDVMVANAGIGHVKSLLEMTTADVDRVYAVNIRGVHLCYKFAARHMIKQGTGGKLIAACSLAGFRGSSLFSSYVASKFAVRGYNQTAALELAKFGITCNCYAPGFIDTGLGNFKEDDPDSAKARAIQEHAVQRTPLKRIGSPEDVANLVSFLVSRNSDYITGQAIPVGGGYHML